MKHGAKENHENKSFINTSLKAQQREIKLLTRKSVVTNYKGSSLLIHYIKELKKFNELRSTNKAAIFKKQEELINSINEEIIRTRIRLGENSLNLNGCYLTRFPGQLLIDPSLLEYWAKLETLLMYNNDLTTLPTEIERLSKLNYLNLGCNDLYALPAQIGKLPALTYLKLASNNLHSLPAEIGKLSLLETLELQHNQLTVLPWQISELYSLKNFDISFNNLFYLPYGIGLLPALDSLNTSKNHLSVFSDTITIPSENFDDLTRADLVKHQKRHFIELPTLPSHVEEYPCCEVPLAGGGLQERERLKKATELLALLKVQQKEQKNDDCTKTRFRRLIPRERYLKKETSNFLSDVHKTPSIKIRGYLGQKIDGRLSVLPYFNNVPEMNNGHSTKGNTIHRCLLVESERKIMGGIYFTINPSTEVCTIISLGITNKYQGQHLGSILLHTAIYIALHYQCDVFELQSSGYALPFYRNHGFMGGGSMTLHINNIASQNILIEKMKLTSPSFSTEKMHSILNRDNNSSEGLFKIIDSLKEKLAQPIEAQQAPSTEKAIPVLNQFRAGMSQSLVNEGLRRSSRLSAMKGMKMKGTTT